MSEYPPCGAIGDACDCGERVAIDRPCTPIVIVSERVEHIRNSLSDLISNFLYYDRKEDEDLPMGEIEAAVKAGEITIAEMVAILKEELEKGL
jgi:hypothetical protein